MVKKVSLFLRGLGIGYLGLGVNLLDSRLGLVNELNCFGFV